MSTENELRALAERSGRAKRDAPRDAGASLRWHRVASGWRLFDGRRRFGKIVPDSTYPNMWRPLLAGGRLGDMANITWAKHAVLEAAVRELEWEGGRKRATDPSKCPEKSGVFEGARPHSRSDATLERPSRAALQQVGRAGRARPQGTPVPGSAITPEPRPTGPTRRAKRPPLSQALRSDRREAALPEPREHTRQFEAREAAGERRRAPPPRRASLRSGAGRSPASDAAAKVLISETVGGVGSDHVTQI
jgi:hypothetical protein